MGWVMCQVPPVLRKPTVPRLYSSTCEPSDFVPCMRLML